MPVSQSTRPVAAGAGPQAGGEAGAGAGTGGRGRLWFAASLPPPVDGQKACNAAMLARLSDGAAPVRLDLGRTMPGKLARALANGWTLLRRARAGDVAYLSVPGQTGVWLLIPAIAALRARGARMWFHHHSYRPINRAPLAAMRALVAWAGPRQNHILLSDGMRDRFAALYLARKRGGERGGQRGGQRGQAHALSNVCLFPPDTRVPPASRPDRPPTIGHLSVLTRAKGVGYLLDLFDDLAARVPGIRLVLAGPVRDPGLARAIAAAADRHGAALDYRGAVAGEDKARFYRDIDLFVLPTTLVDEAEPLVMIEAYARGVDVFATSTGCIPDRLRDPARTLTLDRGADAALVAQAASATPGEWAALRRACHGHVVRLAATSARQGEALLHRIRSAPARPGPAGAVAR